MKSPEEERKYIFHFLPNTHWDREWLYDFQETRMFLVEFLDKLLEIFKNYPDYNSYLLDSQIIPIEDYLEIRPEKKDEIIELVKKGRLQVGPWYTLPEEHLVNGESLVRNLLFGHQLSEKYGGVMKIGYSPFSYGQASQMPQIYKGFNIDTILFYHGVQAEEVPAEFIFEGADGTQILASRMGSNARYNFFFSVYRPTVFGKETLERDYDWKEKGLPFHFASNGKHTAHHILVDPIKNLDVEKLKQSLIKLKNEELEHCTTEHIACMQGMDSTQPDVYELKVFQEAEKIIDHDEMHFSSLPEYIEKLKNSIKWNELKVLKGERRTPRQLGTRKHLYGDVTSTRTVMKRKNTLAENELQRKAEPFAAIAYLLGDEYRKNYLDIAWKYLLQSHPHDSIAGTGIDQIENDVHHRLDQCRNISKGIYSRSLQFIQKNINNSDLSENDIALTVFNASPFIRSEVINAVIDIPNESEFNNYSIIDPESGSQIEYQEEFKHEHPAVVRHLGDATMMMDSQRTHLNINIENIPALGYKTLLIKPIKTALTKRPSLVTGLNQMENDFLKVTINENGTLDIFEKTTQHEYKGIHYFEDNGEAGHAWRHIPPANDKIINSKGSKPEIELINEGPLSATYSITYKLSLPKKLDEGERDYITRLDGDGDDAGRSADLTEIIICSEFTLTSSSKGLKVNTKFVNTCEDHRLRIMFPTNLNASFSYAEEPFDVVEREIDRGKNSPWAGTWNPTHPHQRFVDVSDGSRGLAIINDGLREYEVTDDKSRTIGITLVRAFELALTTVAWKWERHPEMKGSQSLKEHEFNYTIYPHEGDWDKGNVLNEAEKLNVPLEIIQAGKHEGDLPKKVSFITLAGGGLTLSAIKRAENSNNIIIRINNPTEREITGMLTAYFKINHAKRVNLNEEFEEDLDKYIIDNKLVIKFHPKKIHSIELDLTN